MKFEWVLKIIIILLVSILIWIGLAKVAAPYFSSLSIDMGTGAVIAISYIFSAIIAFLVGCIMWFVIPPHSNAFNA